MFAAYLGEEEQAGRYIRDAGIHFGKDVKVITPHERNIHRRVLLNGGIISTCTLTYGRIRKNILVFISKVYTLVLIDKL